MKTTLISLFLLAFLPVVNAAEHVIYIQNEQVSIRCPASWVIIAHKPAGSPSDVVAFQILNPADAGSDDSTNLSVVAFDVRTTEAMLKFTQSILEHEKLKHQSKEIGIGVSTHGTTSRAIQAMRFEIATALPDHLASMCDSPSQTCQRKMPLAHQKLRWSA